LTISLLSHEDVKMQALRIDKSRYASLALALAVAGLLVVLTGDSSAGGTNVSLEEEVEAIRRTGILLKGIPQHGTALGSPRAPVTLQFFGDLQCSESRQVMLGALPFLIRHWVRQGKLRIRFRSLKTDTPEWPEFTEQQAAALAAGRQGKLWTFIDLFYREQGPEFTYYADDGFLEGIAAQARVNLESWESNRETVALVEEIESDEAMAKAKKMESTPSFLIGPTGGASRRLRHFSLEETTAFDEEIRGLLRD
jgi:protein-disulfide isomerase